MNGVGSWYDNAPMESFFGTLTSERVHHCTYGTREEARADFFFYIEARYNRRRLHSALGYLGRKRLSKPIMRSKPVLTLYSHRWGKAKPTRKSESQILAS